MIWGVLHVTFPLTYVMEGRAVSKKQRPLCIIIGSHVGARDPIADPTTNFLERRLWPIDYPEIGLRATGLVTAGIAGLLIPARFAHRDCAFYT